MRILLTGATGMVGGHVLKLCLGRDDVPRVTTVGRRATGLRHTKLENADIRRLAGVTS